MFSQAPMGTHIGELIVNLLFCCMASYLINLANSSLFAPLDPVLNNGNDSTGRTLRS